MGSGKQIWPWISLTDCVAALIWLLTQSSLQGPFNLVAPSPVSNREFTKELGKALSRPTIMPLPAFLLRTALGEMADGVLLASCRAEPKRLLDSGFEFQFPTLQDFMRHEFSQS